MTNTFLLDNALGAFNLDELKSFASILVPAEKKPTLKNELFKLVRTRLLRDAQAVWESLDAKERLVIAAAFYSQDGCLHPSIFASADEQPLPDSVESFIKVVDKQARALKQSGLALQIECADEETAQAIAKHKLTKPLCQLANKQTLFVPVGSEKAFRKAVNVLGYGLPHN